MLPGHRSWSRLSTMLTRFSASSRRGAAPVEHVFFLHIPKCGGTSVARALHAAYPGGASQQLHARVSRDAAGTAGVAVPTLREHLLLYWMSDPHVRCITGHFDYSAAAHAAHGSRFRSVTVLRDPVDRWISHFYFRYFRTTDPVRLDGNLEDFLTSTEAARWGKTYLHKLVPEHESLADDEATELALERLASFDVVGTTERMDSFVDQLRGLLSVDLDIDRLNASPVSSSKRATEITPAIQEHIAALCAIDQLIYEHARKRSA